MKLSKRQQEIIKKLKEGYEIRYYGGSTSSKLSWIDGGFTVVETVSYPTFSKLCDIGAIHPENHTDYPRSYVLTEKFKQNGQEADKK